MIDLSEFKYSTVISMNPAGAAPRLFKVTKTLPTAGLEKSLLELMTDRLALPKLSLRIAGVAGAAAAVDKLSLETVGEAAGVSTLARLRMEIVDVK